MLQDEKRSIPIHQTGPNLNCPLVDNRCDHCGVSILAYPDIQMDEIMSSTHHQETAEQTMLPPPPPYQAFGDGTPCPTPVLSAAEGPAAPMQRDDETQPTSVLAASRRIRRRRRHILRIRITLRFKIGAREREKTVTFL
ncbi:unnamed protein product [Clonostachys rosea]|uniref:Uncharacterized protein n=1 Tax=Bionectria ochroleuca TaxID=29856 RepID=A0ABY6UZC0_BIOOC|nr:unnamed protein product [Clonostachys rosea]